MRLSSSRLLQAVLLVAVVTFAAAGWIRVQRQAAFEERLRLEAAVAAVPLFSPAPDITLFDRQGNPVQLSSYRGRMVFVNFWATWCGPCRVELPFLARWAAAHPEVVVLGVSVDADRDAVRRLAPSLALPYPILFGDAATQAAYGVTTLPTTILVDAGGRVHAAHTGIALGPQLDLLGW